MAYELRITEHAEEQLDIIIYFINFKVNRLLDIY